MYVVRVCLCIYHCEFSVGTPKNVKVSEKEKKKAYNQRVIQLEHGTFSPLVFSVYSDSGTETKHVIRILCSKVARKRKLKYNHAINWFRTKISIELVKGAILCIRGSRDWRNKVHTDLDNIELMNTCELLSMYEN